MILDRVRLHVHLNSGTIVSIVSGLIYGEPIAETFANAWWAASYTTHRYTLGYLRFTIAPARPTSLEEAGSFNRARRTHEVPSANRSTIGEEEKKKNQEKKKA